MKKLKVYIKMRHSKYICSLNHELYKNAFDKTMPHGLGSVQSNTF